MDTMENYPICSDRGLLIQITEVLMQGWVQVPVQAAIITDLLVHHVC